MRLRLLSAIFIVLLFACNEEMNIITEPDPVNLTNIPYQPEEYSFFIHDQFPVFEQPIDNKMTIDGVVLGRHLFYDPILSLDSTISCSSCHMQQGSFTDNLAVSPGVDGLTGSRSSMSLINVGYYYNGLFWDGRSETLEEQALLPIEDPIEMNFTWDGALERLRRSEKYQELFRKAFGIEDTNGITKENASKAIAQFERSIVSSGNSRYDQLITGQGLPPTDDERTGFEIFFDNDPDITDGECGHCHSGALLTNNQYMNNGLQEAEDFEDFRDLGLGGVTGNRIDNGKFRVPTLRNWKYTAPYMHDGSLETIDEVLEHYNSGGKNSKGKDALIVPLGLDDDDLRALKIFLETLNDEEFLENPAYADPNG